MYKSIELEQYDPVTLEPRARVIRTGETLMKTAAPIQEYILELTPQPGRTLLHVIALGAYEYYGPNRNKDAFAEHHHGPDAPVNLPSVAISDEYGGLLDQFQGLGVYEGSTKPLVYETFQNAHTFQHHRNKDPNKRIGDVLRAFYNHDMHRVELVISLDHDRCPPEHISRIDNGDMLAFSMGCHIKYDVCSVCGNRAPTREQYCDHARRMHQPGHEFDTDGKPICVFNPNARFFDISIVFRPADRIGYMLKKIASDACELSVDKGADVLAYNYKRALADKLGDIDKRISGHVENVVSVPEHMEVAIRAIPPMPEHDVDYDDLAEFPFADVIKTAAAEGVMFSASEVAQLLTSKWVGSGNDFTRLASKYASTALAALRDSPDALDEVVASGLFDGRYNAKVASKLQGLKELRGCDRASMLKRAFAGGHKSMFGLDEISPGSNAPSHLAPVTTPQGVTNADAVLAGSKDQTLKSIAKALAAGLLVGGTYRLLAGTGGMGAGVLGAGGSGLYDWLGNNRALPFGSHGPSSAGPISDETLLFKRSEALKLASTGLIESMYGGPSSPVSPLNLSDVSFNTLTDKLSHVILADLLGKTEVLR